MTLATVDLFAGAGGWDVAAHELGLNPLGIEIDEQACLTREAAGFRTLRADISELDPANYPCDILIASPPCTAFSMAGKGKGRDALSVYATAIQHMRLGWPVEREWLDKQCDDATAHLVLEPLRWALALEPTFIACEQVPPVLPLWQLMADVLRDRGYSTWTGVLEAERYGVPQTRERAILMASKIGTVHPPRATHQRYVSGEPARREITLEGELLPWISMAEALGWGMTERPCVTVAAGSGRQGGPDPLDGGSGSRSTIKKERERGWLDRRQGGAPLRAISEPAHTMSSSGLAKGRDVWVQRERSGDRAEEGFDPAAEPSQTLTEKARSWTVHRPSTTICGSNPGVMNPHGGGRDIPSSARGYIPWVGERPATTVNGDPRISEPGHHDENESGSQQKNAVRVSVSEAAILQSFPADFPWQGSRTAQFRQIGNAIPPGLARAILASVLETKS